MGLYMEDNQNKICKKYFIEFGEKLRLARVALGMEVAEVANRLLVNKQRVIEIENGNYANIISQLHLRWYLTSYAKVVDLSEHEIPNILSEFGNTTSTIGSFEKSAIDIRLDTRENDEKKNNGFYTILFLSLVLVIIIYLPNRERDNEQIRYIISYLQQKFITSSNNQ
jgi:cytoskeletal protein RodZ